MSRSTPIEPFSLLPRHPARTASPFSSLRTAILRAAAAAGPLPPLDHRVSSRGRRRPPPPHPAAPTPKPLPPPLSHRTNSPSSLSPCTARTATARCNLCSPPLTTTTTDVAATTPNGRLDSSGIDLLTQRSRRLTRNYRNNRGHTHNHHRPPFTCDVAAAVAVALFLLLPSPLPPPSSSNHTKP
ncbi:hypothetical protein Nepgr_028220 [Nepenthes gracilis]|uniref:Uncharacterized protein n=1 Tax=Nepenthes gracilis TaxID=150966 RepID=A0AAD3TBJ7_NEPGR|nr:hypothetical protein Nepgr_028220 [Nepenthes gracilis]